jgi:hypothetical protein
VEDSSSPNAAWDLTFLEQQPRMIMAKFALSLLVAATHAVVLLVVVVSRIHALQSLCWVLVLSPATVFLTVWQPSLEFGCRDGPSFRLDLSNVAHGALSVLRRSPCSCYELNLAFMLLHEL